MGFKTFNDRLAIIVLVIILAIWAAPLVRSGLRVDATVLGATIMGFTLVLQYYFRKEGPTPPAPPTP